MNVEFEWHYRGPSEEVPHARSHYELDVGPWVFRIYKSPTQESWSLERHTHFGVHYSHGFKSKAEAENAAKDFLRGKLEGFEEQLVKLKEYLSK